MTIKQIGSRLYSLRAQRGWTMRTMAEKAGCSASTVLRIEAGLPALSDTLDRVARALGAKLELR